MNKRGWLALILAVCLLALTACQSANNSEPFQVVTNVNQLPTQNVTVPDIVPVVDNTPDYDYDTGDYDPASEEDPYAEDEWQDATTVSSVPTPAPVISSAYAGATPVVLDPIDKPTPTPAPALTITDFMTYDATKLSLSFSGPVGWQVNDLASDTFILTNPDPSVDYQAELVVRAVAVANNYGETDMKKEVKTLMNNLKVDYSSFSATNTASRTLMDKKGIYADFNGVRKDTGASVWGRIHLTCINKTLIVMRLTCPRTYSETYKDTVYSKFRHTVKFTR